MTLIFIWVIIKVINFPCISFYMPLSWRSFPHVQILFRNQFFIVFIETVFIEKIIVNSHCILSVMWDLGLSHNCVKMVLWDKTRIAEPLYYHKHKIMQLCMSAKNPSYN